MIEVIGVSFKEKGTIYYFSSGSYDLRKNVTVIVQTERGLQFGKVEIEKTEVSREKLGTELQRVIRIASRQDYFDHKKNVRDAKEALQKCRELVEKYNLNMRMIDAVYTFDRSQLMFRFLADSRVDFRELAKALAAIYKTRIELRQIGVRDKAREIGGCGMCGKRMCCAQFLYDFDSVSISMAKNQNLSLNPAKINGVCGRLLCCLKYEDQNYTECRKNCPNIGKKMMTEHGEGTVTAIDVLNQTYKIEVPNFGTMEKRVNGNN